MNTEQFHIDIKENTLLKINKDLLSILLKDKTTGKPIIWGTDNYRKHGEKYNANCCILIEQITGRNGNTIEYLGMWETLYNDNFNPIEFEGVEKKQD